MFVNTNVSALQSVLDLQNTTNSMDNVLQQLSSGYQINSAADNPAGLAISQQMQTQIDGLNQAQQNTQAGISLLQTADGALSNVDSILQSMRSLASQAATGTNNATDLQALQSEMNQYSQEITSITNTTQFNTLNLLSGAFGGAVGGKYNSQGQYVGGTQTPLQYMQIGANAGQELALGINPVDAVSLGVAGLTSTVGTNTLNLTNVADLGAGLSVGTWTVTMTGATQATLSSSLSGLTLGGTFEGATNVTYTVTGISPAAAGSGTVSTTTNALSVTAVNAVGYGLLTGSYTISATTYTQATATIGTTTAGTGAQALTVTTVNDGAGTVSYSLTVATNTSGSYVYTLTETGGGAATTIAQTFAAATTQVAFADSANAATITVSSTVAIASVTGYYGVTDTAAAATFQLENSSGTAIGASVTVSGYPSLSTAITVGNATGGQTLSFTLGTVAGSFLKNLTTQGATVGTAPINTTVNVTGSGDWSYSVIGSDGFTTTIATTVTTSTGATSLSLTDGSSTITFATTTGFGSTTPFSITATAASATFELLNGSNSVVGSAATVTGYPALSATVTVGDTNASDANVGQYVSFSLSTATGSVLQKLVTVGAAASTTGSVSLSLASAGSAAVTNGGGVVTTNATVTSGVNIGTQFSAAAALNTIDKAITIVDQQRANIGAYQNRLQFASSNASTGSVNLSSAQAGIMDTNMALQMANLSKYQVLQQSGIAMLAQANQIPQALLKIIG